MALTNHLERLGGQTYRPAIYSFSATKKRIAKAKSIELYTKKLHYKKKRKYFNI